MAPWTRQLGCVLACYAPIGRRRRSRETLVLRIRRSEGRVVNTPLVFKKGLFLRTRKKRKTGKKPGEREERDRKKPGEKKIREKSEEEQKERTRDPERESAKPALNGEKGLSPEIGVKKTMNAGGVEHEYMN
ncbi:hypothetical protein TNCV_1841171 [Trichonephila clavipes]|nr:hypothetical protein TNCV_1841171 [Trichonephila clavipes]